MTPNSHSILPGGRTASRFMPAPDPAKESERGAFNAAFYELGLRWYWDTATYDALAGATDDGSRLRRYLQTRQAHLLSAYDPDFLIAAILDAKARCHCTDGRSTPRSVAHLDWTDPRWAEIGV